MGRIPSPKYFFKTYTKNLTIHTKQETSKKPPPLFGQSIMIQTGHLQISLSLSVQKETLSIVIEVTVHAEWCRCFLVPTCICFCFQERDDDLATLVKQKLHPDLFCIGFLFRFCGSSSRKIKGLVWEEDDFLLLTNVSRLGFSSGHG